MDGTKPAHYYILPDIFYVFFKILYASAVLIMVNIINIPQQSK